MRAVHLKVEFSLETDAFINVLRRFINRRGKPHMFYNDNGTNIVRGYQELRRSLQELNQSVIEEQLKQQQIRWNFNPPYASHMGGIWERVIRFIKRVLSAITTQQALTDDALLTLFSEAEHVVNSLPLTPITMDPEGEEPLTPNHLLMFRPTAQQAPGKFDCRRRRLAGHLFQDRWKDQGRGFILLPPWPPNCLGQMLTVRDFSQHLVSSSKTIRPNIPRGARCMGHCEMM